MLAITIGAGRRNPRGRRLPLEPQVPPARALAEALARQPASKEAWWSPHLWQGEHRKQDGWEGASAIAIDLDYHDAAGTHTEPPAESVRALQTLAATGALPGSLLHLTPRGARLVFCLPDLAADRERWEGAAREAGRRVAAAIGSASGYRVDPAVLVDTARFLYSPRAKVDGKARDAAVQVLRDEPYTLEELQPADTEPPAPPQPKPVAVSLEDAIQRYNADHAREWPKSDGDCPACGHRRCFARLPSDPSRWVCFSSSHSQPGIQANNCHHGDALDLDAYTQSLKPAELLRREGYLPAARLAPAPPAEAGTAVGTESATQDPAPLTYGKGYATVVQILRHDSRVIPEPLEWNEMLCSPTIGGVPVEDSTVGVIRERIECYCRDSKGKPLRPSAADITMAIDQVAQEHRYHPVAEYLRSLRWDGLERISLVAPDVLGVKDSELAQFILRRWFISAVARPLDPGCKVDTVLILKGSQGALKSTFFATLAGPDWFADTAIDIGNKDALLILRRVWILEWAELEAMSRARDAGAVKAFLSSRSDTYRPPFGRRVVDAKRHCVIVGSTNEDDILSDSTGNRRYWVLPVPGRIDTAALARWRDQLWAEAVHLYRSGERWWLTPDEEAVMEEAQAHYLRSDPWEELIGAWLSRRDHFTPLTTSEVLDKALRKPEGQWTSADQRRVASVLRALGYESRTERDAGGGRARCWIRRATG